MHFNMSSAVCFNLDQSKILSSGNELNTWMNIDIVVKMVCPNVNPLPDDKF